MFKSLNQVCFHEFKRAQETCLEHGRKVVLEVPGFRAKARETKKSHSALTKKLDKTISLAPGRGYHTITSQTDVSLCPKAGISCGTFGGTQQMPAEKPAPHQAVSTFLRNKFEKYRGEFSIGLPQRNFVQNLCTDVITLHHTFKVFKPPFKVKESFREGYLG